MPWLAVDNRYCEGSINKSININAKGDKGGRGVKVHGKEAIKQGGRVCGCGETSGEGIDYAVILAKKSTKGSS